jgi:hypothetical protein
MNILRAHSASLVVKWHVLSKPYPNSCQSSIHKYYLNSRSYGCDPIDPRLVLKWFPIEHASSELGGVPV